MLNIDVLIKDACLQEGTEGIWSRDGSHTGVLVALRQPAQAVARPPSRLAAAEGLPTKSSASGCRISENFIPDFLNSVSTASIALKHCHRATM